MTRLSLRAAIDKKCRECIHDPFGGNGQWREAVEQCSSSNCPLHPVRPRSNSERLGIKKPASSPQDEPRAVESADDEAPDVSALLGGIFKPEGASNG